MSVGFLNTTLSVGTLELQTGFAGNLNLSCSENLSADAGLQFVVNDNPFQFTLTNFATLESCVIQNLSSLTATVSTANNTATQIIGVNVDEGQVTTLTGTIVGVQTNYSKAISGTFSVSARRAPAGSPALVGGLTDAGFVGQSDDVLLAVTAAISGNTLQVKVTGLAATNFDWKAQYMTVTN